MRPAKAKAKPVKAWAVYTAAGVPGNRRRSDFLWIGWSKRAAEYLADDEDERVVRVLITPIEAPK